MRPHRHFVVLLSLLSVGCFALPSTAQDTRGMAVGLPAGWRSEGMAAGKNATLFIGSVTNGAVFRADTRSGEGTQLHAGEAGASATGVEYEKRGNRIWLAGGATGEVRVLDADSGVLLAKFKFVPGGYLNDLVVTKDAVYITNSLTAVLHVITLPDDGSLPAPSALRTIPLTGEIAYGNGVNAAGIAWFKGALLVVQSNTGKLFHVDPTTGATAVVDLGGLSLSNADGLELRGNTLYVVRNQSNQIVVVRLRSDVSGEIAKVISDPDLDQPVAATIVGAKLWALNGPIAAAKPSVVRVEP